MLDTLQQNPILEHYQQEARAHGLAPTSTMSDQITRTIEVEAILDCMAYVQREQPGPFRLLEIGCGNGYLLKQISSRFPDAQLNGLDYSPDMVALANQQGLENCQVRQGDVRNLEFADSSFDVIVSERCVINLLDQSGQDAALRELQRVLKVSGHLILIEAFTDGLEQLNRARVELGLSENVVPHHNLWFDKAHFLNITGQLFTTVVPSDNGDPGLPLSNLLSTHYFISRVLYPSVTRREILYNTEFVKFFRFLMPIGNYSPLQLFLFRKDNEA